MPTAPDSTAKALRALRVLRDGLAGVTSVAPGCEPGALPKEFDVRYAGVRGRTKSPSVDELARRGWRAIHHYPQHGSYMMVREAPRRLRLVAFVVAFALVALVALAGVAYGVMVYESHHDYIGQESE